MSTSIKVASFWEQKINIAILESLYADKGYAPTDCILGISPKSGFYVHLYHKDKKERRFKAFIPESSVLTVRDILPTLFLRILESQERADSGQTNQEQRLFQSRIRFHFCSGMNVADLLANHFSEIEMRELLEIMKKNMDKYPENAVLCDGLTAAIHLIQENRREEISGIIRTYSAPRLHLHDGAWEKLGLPDENDLIQKSKLDVFVNFQAERPFLIRVTNRLCKQTASDGIVYPYSGNQTQTLYFTLSSDDFLGKFWRPMELSCNLFREKQYTKKTEELEKQFAQTKGPE